MAIQTICDSCFSRAKVAEKLAGTKIPCKSCGEAVIVPIPQQEVRAYDLWEEGAADDEAGADPYAIEETAPAQNWGRRKDRRRTRSTSPSPRPARPLLGRHSLAQLIALQVVTAIPGFYSPGCRILFAGFWLLPAFAILMMTLSFPLTSAWGARTAVNRDGLWTAGMTLRSDSLNCGMPMWLLIHSAVALVLGSGWLALQMNFPTVGGN